MGIKEFKESYNKLDAEEIKKDLDFKLIEIRSFGDLKENVNIHDLSITYCVLYDIAKKYKIFNESDLEKYKIKYFDAIKKLVEDLEEKLETK